MIGLFCSYYNNDELENSNNNHDIKKEDDIKFVIDCWFDKRVVICRKTLNKFLNDKVFYYSDKYVIVFDGVILNLKDLLNKNNKKSLDDLIIYYYERGKISFLLNEMRGSFEGIIYDRLKNEIVFFVDQLGNRTLFYYLSRRALIISSEVQQIVEELKKSKLDYSLDLAAAYSMLTYGYMYNNHTLINEIKRVKEGEIYIYREKKLSLKKYYSIDNNSIDISQQDAIEGIDHLFRKSVLMQYRKNREYNYDNYTPLSAGLDSRMTSYITTMVADEPVINFTYSQTNELDQIIPAKIAKFLNNRWIFKSLDNGLDLMNLEESCKIADTLIYYAWPAQLNDFMKFFDTSKWGIVHTGVIGDVVVGSFYKNDEVIKNYQLGDGAFSNKLIFKLNEYLKINEDIEYERGMISNRAINGACLGYSTTFRYYTEALSPFMELDFFAFCMKIPLKFRVNHKIYYNWILQKHPQMARFSHNGKRIATGHRISIAGRSYPVLSIPSLVIKKYKQDVGKEAGMNPLQQWYNNNYKLKQYMDTFFKNNLEICEGYDDLMIDAKKLYDCGNAQEKIMVLSLLESIKMLF